MKKKIVIFLILFSGIVFLYNYIFSPLSNSYRNIEQIWGVNIPFQIGKDDLIDKNLYFEYPYFIAKLSDDEMDDLLNMDMSKYNYTQWDFVKENLTFRWGYIEKDFLCSIYKKKSESQFKGIYVNKEKNEVIFLDYEWGGY